MEETAADAAPTAEGSALSQAIETNGFVYTWGQTPRDPETREVVGDDMGTQTEQVMENISTILQEAGVSLDDVVKTTVYITEMNDYDAFNEVYQKYMSEPYPARSVVKVAGLSTGVRVEIEVVAER